MSAPRAPQSGGKGMQEPTQRERNAYHEAGHVVTCFELGIPVRYASLGGTSTAEGRPHTLVDTRSVDTLRREPNRLLTASERDRLERGLVELAGGMAAEGQLLRQR